MNRYLDRGIFGIAGLISDYRTFRRHGNSRWAAASAAIDYWRWNFANWMAWNGKPRR